MPEVREVGRGGTSTALAVPALARLSQRPARRRGGAVTTHNLCDNCNRVAAIFEVQIVVAGEPARDPDPMNTASGHH